jgi:hypothetical protein
LISPEATSSKHRISHLLLWERKVALNFEEISGVNTITQLQKE